jgi:hypothetical protein
LLGSARQRQGKVFQRKLGLGQDNFIGINKSKNQGVKACQTYIGDCWGRNGLSGRSSQVGFREAKPDIETLRERRDDLRAQLHGVIFLELMVDIYVHNKCDSDA